MRKCPVISVSLVLFVFLALACASYAGVEYPRILVYKGTISSAKAIVDINDTKNLVTNATKILYVIHTYDPDANHSVISDSNAVIYDTRHRYYKLLPGGSAAIIGDPCGAMLCILNSSDAAGSMVVFFTGKGKLIKYSSDPLAPKAYVSPAFNGSGWLMSYDIFDPAYEYSGPVSMSLKLDLGATRKASADGNTPLQVVTEQINKFESQGGWTRWGE